ncbi:Cytochrome P450 76A2 [Euphorbia peplus]|nr:Cytochrome P450 76A2 [Euphorbia peplus]
MENPSNYLIPLITFLILSATFMLRRRRNSGGRFPPGPSGWPIIGNLLDFTKLPHRTLNDMKQKHGHIIGLKLGSINTFVILSAKAASELFRNHDLDFADRIFSQTISKHDFNKGALSLLPYGSHWRVLRKLMTVDMLGNKKINETAFVRRKCMDDMICWIENEEETDAGINIADFVFLMMFNMMGNLVFSRDAIEKRIKRVFRVCKESVSTNTVGCDC